MEPPGVNHNVEFTLSLSTSMFANAFKQLSCDLVNEAIWLCICLAVYLFMDSHSSSVILTEIVTYTQHMWQKV